MTKKLDILKLFAEEPLASFALANLLDIKPNYARQIILRLKRQGLIFPHPTFAGGQGYSLTAKGEERISYLADKEKTRQSEVTVIAGKERDEAIAEKQRDEAIQKRPMSLHQAISQGLPKEIEGRICREFGIASARRLASKKLSEIVLPQKIWEETGFAKLSGERILAYRQLPFDVWIKVLENISKSAPKPQHLSIAEVLILTALPKQKKGEFLVTKDGEVFYAPGKGYLTPGAAAILAQYRKAKRTR
jgi:DNA-binding PadR family transcriptional regulator